MRNFYLSFLFVFSTVYIFAQSTASFESFELPIDTFLNNAETTRGYKSGDAFFPNNYNQSFGGYWESGWAISTMRDDSTGDFTNLYSAKPASGSESATYAVGQQHAIIHIEGNSMGKVVNGLYLTNTTYAYTSMRNGDGFAKKFGGENGTDPDFFRLEIRKFRNGSLDTNAVIFYLADFRFEADSSDYIVNDWVWVNLSNLGNVDSLQFTLVTSDVGENGPNTPLFFCMDNLEISNEISTSLPTLLPKEVSISLFPNPTTASIQVELWAKEWQGIAQVFDLNGRQLLVQILQATNNKMDVSSLFPGAYILQLKTEKGLVISSTFTKN